MIPRKYYIRDVARREIAKCALSRHFQFKSSNRYRPKALKPLFRDNGDFVGEYHHQRGFRRMAAIAQDCLDDSDALVQKAVLKKKKYQCLFSREWDHDHFRHALSGGKSWKRRCRKRHQWERHCHSQFEMGWLKMGYKCYRHFILKKLGENGGTFTFNTSHRDDLEDILTDMELSGEILLDIGLDYIRSHASITAHIP